MIQGGADAPPCSPPRASADPNTGLNDRPSWSPDASKIAFRHDYSNAGDNQIATLPAAGGVPTVITAFPAPQSYVQPALSYSPTGRLAYSTGTPGAAFASNDIYVDGRSVYTAPNGICGLSWGSFQGTRVDAAFTSAASGGQGGFQFTSTSTSSDGSPLTERWDFGDGASGAGRTVTHTYARPGTYTVTLTSTNRAGTSGTATGSVTVAPATISVSVQPTITPGGLRVGADVDVPVTVTAGPYDLYDVTVGPLTASSDAARVGPAPAGTAGITLAARESRTFTGRSPGRSPAGSPSPTAPLTTTPEDRAQLKTARDVMDIANVYEVTGTCRGAAAMSGTSHTRRCAGCWHVRRPGRHRAGRRCRGRRRRMRCWVVETRVRETDGRISAKRLLPAVRAAGFTGPTTGSATARTSRAPGRSASRTG